MCSTSSSSSSSSSRSEDAPVAGAVIEAGAAATGGTTTWVGRILRKRKLSEWIILHILPLEEEKKQQQHSVPVYLAREQPPAAAAAQQPSVTTTWFNLSIVRVTGSYQERKNAQERKSETANKAAKSTSDGSSRYWVAQSIELVQCAPNPDAVVERLAAIRQQSGGGRAQQISTLLPYHQDNNNNNYEQAEQQLRELLLLDSSNNENDTTAATTALNKRQIAMIVRGLLGRADEPRGRHRLPHTKRAARALLENLEASVPLWTPQPLSSLAVESPSSSKQRTTSSTTGGDDDKEEPSQTNASCSPSQFNLPQAEEHDDEVMMSSRGPLSRQEYLLRRKHPQISWMVERIRQLLPPLAATARRGSMQYDDNNKSEPAHQPHIVDVGGGRGDLTVALALAFPTARLTLVDCNASSLEAARQYAIAANAVNNNNIDFCHMDFGEYMQYQNDNKRQRPDVVVALHACGDLSDAALQYALDTRSAFCICPCCYTKRYLPNFVPPYVLERQQKQQQHLEQPEASSTAKDNGDNSNNTAHQKEKKNELTVLGKMAETDERPDLCRRAAIVFNSMRLQSIVDSRHHARVYGNSVRLEEYDYSSSSRNLVLVGRAPSIKQ